MYLHHCFVAPRGYLCSTSLNSMLEFCPKKTWSWSTATYPQVYIPKRRTLIQVLTPLKFLCYLLMNIFGKMNICMSRFGVRIGWRKYLYECTPFGYVNLCICYAVLAGVSKCAISQPSGLWRGRIQIFERRLLMCRLFSVFCCQKAEQLERYTGADPEVRIRAVVIIDGWKFCHINMIRLGKSSEVIPHLILSKSDNKILFPI